MKAITEHYEAYARILAKKYGYTLNIKYADKKSCSAGGSGANWTISERSLQAHFMAGFSEYHPVVHVWQETGYWRGKDAIGYSSRVSTTIVGDMTIWAIALHEFAHIMQEGKYAISTRQKKNGKIIKVRDVHGEDFQRLLKKLITENPYKPEFWIDEQKKSLKSAISYFEQFI